MNNYFRKFIATTLAVIIVVSSTSVAGLCAVLKAERPVTMGDILSSEEKVIEISEESTYWPESDVSVLTPSVNVSTAKAGNKYPIKTRVVKTSSSSNGLKACSSKNGLYKNISMTVLSFISGIPGMKVSAIFSVVSLAVSGDQYSQAKTFYSYINTTKKGEAKWANTSYNTLVLSGRRDYYKHVLAGIRNKQNKWTTKSHDYLNSPAKVLKGFYYTKSNSWFKEQAKQRLLTGQFLDDLPW